MTQEEINNAFIELVKEEHEFVISMTNLLNTAIKIIDIRVTNLENAGHVTDELPEIEEAIFSHRDQLDLPFPEKGEQK